ncbi:MAG: DUF4893 domain-containing protein [Allosphingosinicella sp.]
MKPLLPALAAAFLLSACGPRPVGPEAAVPVEAAWRSVATSPDRERLREWRTAFTQALAKARAAGHAAEIEAEGALLRPDAALPGVTPPPGDYACRVTKVGAKAQGLLDYVAYPAFACRIGPGPGEVLDFVKRTGSQRPVGRLFPENPRRMVFLGTLQLGDEAGTLRYGHDPERDMAGLLERVGDDRWRLLFPYPAFESTMDVLELVPAA